MAKYEYKTLKNIDEKVEKVIEKLNMVVSSKVNQAIENKQNFYVTTAFHKETKVIFKARIADHRVLQQWGKNFRNERRFLRALKKDPGLNSIDKFLPEYINSRINGVEWLMYKYIEVDPVGSDHCNFIEPSRRHISEIIQILSGIHKFDIKKFCNNYGWTKNITRMDSQHYLDYFNKIKRLKKKEFKHVIDQSMLEKGHSLLVKKRKLLDRKCNFLTHGDFHPANIFIDQNAIAIDWENLHINNIAFDITTLWFRMANHKKYRKLLLEEFTKTITQKEDFKQLFRLNILSRLPAETTIWANRLKKAEDNTDEHKKTKKICDLCYSNYMSAINNQDIESYE